MKSIFCIGDNIVDEYIQVRTDRYCQEAPVPIWHIEEERIVRYPGGAGNVFACLQGVQKKLVSIPGVLPTKRRFMVGNKQVGRLDIERTNYGMTDCELRYYCQTLYDQTYPVPDVAILSDYGKGFFLHTAATWVAALQGCKIIVDPKDGPLDRWFGCDVVKLNEQEALKFTGTIDPNDQLNSLCSQLKKTSFIVTRGATDVFGYDAREKEAFWQPTRAVKALNTVGAGDAFVAFLAKSLAHDAPFQDAVREACLGAESYVQRPRNGICN